MHDWEECPESDFERWEETFEKEYEEYIKDGIKNDNGCDHMTFYQFIEFKLYEMDDRFDGMDEFDFMEGCV